MCRQRLMRPMQADPMHWRFAPHKKATLVVAFLFPEMRPQRSSNSDRDHIARRTASPRSITALA